MKLWKVKIQRLCRLLLHVSEPMTNALMCVCRDGLGSKLVLLSCPVIGGAGSLGHSRTGGLWPPEASLLSRHRCDPNVFLHRQPWQFGWDFLFVNVFFTNLKSASAPPCSTCTPCAWCREYSREVDSGGEALLSQCAHYPCGKQERPAKWRAHTSRVS